jgi:hypothetical protein
MTQHTPDDQTPTPQQHQDAEGTQRYQDIDEAEELNASHRR